VPKRTNEEWLRDLREPGPVREAALSDLHQILLFGLRRGLLNRINTSVPEFDAQAEDFVQEALLKILDNLDTFAGRSLFTTWAHKIAVSVALTELRRKRWQDTSLDGIMDVEGGVFTPSFVADPDPEPENAAERAEMITYVHQIIAEELTDKQRQAMIASVIQDRPTREVAAEMDMKPNALYKLLHDARVKLKRRLARQGLTPADVLSVFE
jgi:RNA polymerase sigma-70 factor (ECF subfamily)